jgi:hypothetical protein
MQMEANEDSKVQTVLSLCSCQSNACTVTQPTSTVEYCSPLANCFETCMVSPFLLYNAWYSLLTLNERYSRILKYVYKYEYIIHSLTQLNRWLLLKDVFYIIISSYIFGLLLLEPSSG